MSRRSSLLAEYYYDAYGNMMGRTLDPDGTPSTSYYLYDGDRIAQEVTASGTLIAVMVGKMGDDTSYNG